MAFNIKSDDEEFGTLSQINTVPLVDVMLVLLILFLITIPVITKTVPIDLPKASNQPTQTTPENITIAVDERGRIYWDDSIVRDNDALAELIRSVAVQVPQPEIHVRGDREVRYEHVGRVIMMVQRGGIQKVGFISEPDRAMAR